MVPPSLPFLLFPPQILGVLLFALHTLGVTQHMYLGGGLRQRDSGEEQLKEWKSEFVLEEEEEKGLVEAIVDAEKLNIWAILWVDIQTGRPL